MKVAIASDDGKTIASHFGRTRGFVIFEVENGEIKKQEYRLNTFTPHAMGLEGAGHEHGGHASILQALRDCQAVISHGMGWRIYNDLKQANIEAFITDQLDIKGAIELYLKGELSDRPELACSHKDHE